MLNEISKIRHIAVVALTLIVVSIAGASAQDAKDFPTSKSAIPVLIQSEDGTRTASYSQLNAEEKRYVDRVLADLKRADGNLPSLNSSQLKVKPAKPAGLSCGVNSTNAEPIQVGCWNGGKVCYVAVTNDGGLVGGCHDCNGSNCPKK